MSQSPDLTRKARPVLFSGLMAKAILEGRKSQTRRVIKPQPFARIEQSDDTGEWYQWWYEGREPCGAPTREVEKPMPCPYGKPGDLLWLREAFSYESLDVDRNGIMPPWFWADGNPTSGDFTKPKPSIHMPRWASRLTLDVTGVRVERLHDISEEDAIAEGMVQCDSGYWWSAGQNSLHRTAAAAYQELWRKLNGDTSWETNPWVWVLTFAVHQRNVDDLLRERAA